MSASEVVFCHPCARQQQGQRSASGDLVCSVCRSDFCEVVERQAVDQPAQRNGNVFMSSFSMPGAPGVGGADAPRTQVMIIQETISLDQLLGGRAGGLNMGDYASNEQLERIMTQLLQGYAPRHRPTAQAFIDKLPRLQVAPAADSVDGAPTAGQGSQQQQGEGVQEDNARAGEPAAARFACCAAGDACPVCHDAYKHSESVVELPCQHCYHETCILPWLKEHNDCPVCRRKFDSEDAQAPAAASTAAADTGAGAGNGAYAGDPPVMDPMFRLLARVNRRQGAGAQPGGAAAPEAVTADPLASLTPQQRQQREQMREQTRQRVSARHAAMLSQHSQLEARLAELQETSRRQLAEVLQGQTSDSIASEGAAESRAATPLAEMAVRLRDAQRDVEDSQRRLRALEAQMERLADPNAYFNPNQYLSDAVVPPALSPAILEGLRRPARTRAQTPAQAASAAAAAAAVNAAAALRERAGAAQAARQQDEAPRSEADRQRDEAARRARERGREDMLHPENEQEHGQETWQRQPQPQRARVQRRGSSRGPSGSGSDARSRGTQSGPTIAGIVAVDAALALPSFLLSVAEPRPVPLDAFMQPLSADDSNGAPRMPVASTAAAAAALTSAPSATPASLVAGAAPAPTPEAGAAAAQAPATGAVGAAGAAGVVSQEPALRAMMPARQTRSWPVAVVTGALTLPWRILGGMLGLLYSVGGRH